MHDRPSAKELVEAVADFLAREVGPALTDPRLRFRNLIAANVLTVVARELAAADDPAREMWRRLAAAVDGRRSEPPTRAEELREANERMTRELCARIRVGAADEGPAFNAAYAVAYAGVVEKLRVANPKYLDRVLKEG